MGQTARYQEILRKLAMIHEGFVEHKARLGLDLSGPRQGGHPRRFTVIHGATGSALDLCRRRSCGAATSFASR